MTAIIHLNRSETDLTVQKIRFTANALFDCSDRVYAILSHVDWEGLSKEEFSYQLYQCTAKIKELADSLDKLGFNLAYEVEQWVNISTRFTR